MGATISTVSALLKDNYKGPLQRQVNDEVWILSQVDENREDLVGNQAVVPLHIGRTGGIGARAESGTLPTHGNQPSARAVYDLKYLYGRLRLTGPGMAKTKNDTGAFIRMLTFEVEGLKNDLAKDLARQVYGDGTAAIATVASSTGGGTATVVVTLSSVEALTKGQIYVGAFLDIGSLANPVLRNPASSYGIVSAVTPATPSFTATSASGGNFGTPAGSDLVFRAGNALASSVSNEITGLQQLVATATGTVGGINSGTSSYWDNQRINMSSTPINLDTIHQMLNTLRIAGGTGAYKIVTDYGVQLQVFSLLQTQVRFNEPMTLKGGFQTLQYNGNDIVADIDCPWGKMFFLKDEHIKNYTNMDWEFLEEDGKMLKWVVDNDAWDAVIARYMNLGIDRRNVLGVIYGITSSGV